MKTITEPPISELYRPRTTPGDSLEFMTRRDQFAMAAMEGQIAHKGMSDLLEELDYLAMDAYQMADAMLKARQ